LHVLNRIIELITEPRMFRCSDSVAGWLRKAAAEGEPYPFVRPILRMKEHNFFRSDFYEIWCLWIFTKIYPHFSSFV